MYRTIDAAFWTDPKVRELTPNGRFLLLYLITNPHTHVSGIYYLPPLIMQHETGLSPRVLDTLTATLDTLSLARFDPHKELVWVVNMLKFQGSGQKNTLSAAYHISRDIHKSPLIQSFIERYPTVGEALKKIGYAVGATPHSPFPIPQSGEQRTENREQRTEQDSAQDTVSDSAPAEKRGARRDDAAELFRSSYREHIGNPYGWLAGDFEQLAKLRKRLKTATRETPDDWEAALTNYFATPLSEYSLHHLAAKFDTFKNSRLDRFHTPVSHVNGGNGNGQRKSKADITRENGESVLRDIAAHENRSGG